MNKALEDLQAGRDPFVSSHEESAPEHTYTMARLSLWLPIIAAVLSVGVMNALKGETGAIVALVTLATAGVFVIMIVTSIVLGAIALAGMPRNGSEGILGRSLWGIGLSLVLLGFFGVGLLRGVMTSQATRTMHEATLQMQADMKKDIDTGRGISADRQEARLNDLKASMDSAAQGTSGDAALLAQAGSAYLSRIQATMKDYASAANGLRNPPVLDMNGVTQRSQLQARKELVKKFMAENEKLRAFAVNSEQIFNEEMIRVSVPEAERQSGLDAFRKSSAGKHDLQMKIRDDDHEMGVAMLAMLDLLDENWGKWTYNPDRKKVLFNNDATLDQYITYRDEITAAGQEQKKFQSQLVSIGN
jgi:hypothetical protein